MGRLTKYCINFLACHDACLHKSALGYKVSVLMKTQLLPPRWNRSRSTTGKRLAFSKASAPATRPRKGRSSVPVQARGWRARLCNHLFRSARLTHQGAGALAPQSRSVGLEASGKRQSQTRIAGNRGGMRGGSEQVCGL